MLSEEDTDPSVWALRVPGARAHAAAHRLLRGLLSRRLGVAPDELQLVRDRCERCGGPDGRPVLAGTPGLHFSISYAGALALVALAREPVGIDVERPVPGPAWRELAPSLHPSEGAELGHTGAGLRAAALARIWTRKEACLKAIGAGIAHGVCEPYVGCAPTPAAPAGWTLRDVAVPGGYAAAIALRNGSLSAPPAGDRRAALPVRWA